MRTIPLLLFSLATARAFVPGARLNHPRRQQQQQQQQQPRLFATIPKTGERHTTGYADKEIATEATERLLRQNRQHANKERIGEGLLTSAANVDDDDLNVPTTHTKIVTLDCRLKPVDFVPQPLFDGIALGSDENMHRLVFALNAGNYLPGLHELATTMQKGEQARDFPLDAGWGPWREDLAVSVARDYLVSCLGAELLEVGMEIVLGGGTSACVVTEMDERSVTLDSNPPLAGAAYLADVNYISSVTLPQNRRGDILEEEEEKENDRGDDDKRSSHPFEVATFALGCFWGAELAYLRHPGVVGTRVGYTQGKSEDPVTYEEVCTGATGHTEAVQILYDSTQVTYEQLARYAMDEQLGSDKYRLNQVKNDCGTQYRHGLYYHDDRQREIAEQLVDSYGPKCMTEVRPAATFHNAEHYHQQYLYKGGQSARKGDKTTIRCYG